MTSTDWTLERVGPPLRQAGAMDPAFARFLADRLSEEALAAHERADGVSSSGGVRLLHELLWDLEQGNPPDQMSLDLMVVAYARHPEFRPEWNRWRSAGGA